LVSRARPGLAGVPTSLSLVIIFLSVVILPSVVLSMLALRAADREALLVSRQLEVSLMSEVNLAANRVADLLDTIEGELEGEASEIPSNPSLFEGWYGGGRLTDCPFLVSGGKLFIPANSGSAGRRLMAVFGPFLRGQAEIPFFEGIAGVYRKELHDLAAAPGAEKQVAESMITADSALRDEVLRRAEREGFELMQRNVVPVAPAPPADEEKVEASKTVSRGRSFEELRAESGAGILPRITDDGMELLFWSERADGTVAGFLLDGDAVRDRIVGALPEILTGTRILTVLDERSDPLVVPAVRELPEWRLPFVAREISPRLPGWEAGAWLTDPTEADSRARTAERAVWMMVGALFFVIAVGGAVMIRVLTSEMRLARRKTTFVANVSHELKTPLTSIRLFAEMLQSGRLKDEEKRREYLRTMVSEAERLSRLVENVLSFSRDGGGASSLEPLDLAELARETALQMNPGLSDNGFTCSFSADGPGLVLGDPGALRQVVMNLLSNAEKYSGQGREIQVRCVRDRGQAVVEVMDRGPGVAQSQRGKVFQEFFRGDDSLTASKSGAGLGLYIARTIARHHGGDVFYAPREGGGSVFSLSIPLVRDASVQQGGGP